MMQRSINERLMLAFYVMLGSITALLISSLPYAAAEETSEWHSIEFIGVEKLPETPEAIQAGKALYQKKCVWCHGISGKGDGPIAFQMGAPGNPRPRDLTKGMYKFRSTPSGKLPTDEDLFLTITRGLSGTSMPAWRGLTETQRWQLVYYTKTLSGKFLIEQPAVPIEIGREIPLTYESRKQGREFYIKFQCWQCHGTSGRGDGPSAADQKDEWNNLNPPTNLMNPEEFKGGRSPRDIYRTLATGLGGASMPAFYPALNDEQLWHLANYVASLAERGNR